VFIARAVFLSSAHTPSPTTGYNLISHFTHNRRYSIYEENAPSPCDATFYQSLITCDEYVCLFVCLFVCLSVRSHNLKTAWPYFTKFLRMLLVAVARSSSDGVAVRTSGFTDDVKFSYHRANGQNQARRYV